jgi:calcium/calmodulin-dependent protein kinase I
MDTGILKKGDIKDKYLFEKTLGQGSFGEVKKAKNKTTGEEFAVKMINKSDMAQEDLMALQMEVDILSQIDHPNVVKLFEVWEDKIKFYMVMEIMTGGELFDRIVEKDHYSEKEAADTIRPIVDAVRYCHKMGVAHRDLKPENLLYATRDPHSIIKISDFGLAKVYDSSLMMTQCGTPSYVAPEVLEGKGYDEKVDFWSIGIILYILLCGFPPFYDDDNDKLFELISKAKVEFPLPYWESISDLAKDLIRKLLCVDPLKRLNSDQILMHPWMSGDETPRKNLPNITDKIREYNAKKKFKKVGSLAIALGKWNAAFKNSAEKS